MKENFSENLKFFKWLFNKEDIKLESSIDLTLCKDHDDPAIYYPKELGDFFRSSPMKRISRILQLGKFIDNDKFTYHTRFEHCMGTYNKKKQIIINLCKDINFRKYIESNNLKENLIAELIKSAGHDIGHLPLSHVLEISVIQKREFHEIMGKRILTEDAEIRKVLDNISPTLHQSLKKTLSSDIFGLDSIDEGNYDIDRLDYLNRDLFYRGQNSSMEFAPFTLTNIGPKEHAQIVPVFDISCVSEIEKFLTLRQKAYKDSYFHPITQIRDTSVAITLNNLIQQKSPYARNLQQFLINLKQNSDSYQVNLKEYLSWDDLRFYNELLDVAEFSENDSLKQLATFIIPNLDTFMIMTFTMLDLKHTVVKKLSQRDRELVYRIHDLITNDAPFAKNLKDPDYFNHIVKYTMDPEQIHKLKMDTSANKNIIFNAQTLTGYKTSEPIYIRNSDGKIYTIDQLPNRTFDISTFPEQISVAFVLLPLLKQNDIPSILEQNSTNCYSESKKEFNRNPIQVGQKIQSYFPEY